MTRQPLPGRVIPSVKTTVEMRVPGQAGSEVRPDLRGKTQPKRKGLGDRVEQVLSAVGITEERYSHLKELAGFDPGCGCRKRKAFLNEMPRALMWGFLRGGLTGAWEAGVAKAQEINQRFPKGENHVQAS